MAMMGDCQQLPPVCAKAHYDKAKPASEDDFACSAGRIAFSDFLNPPPGARCRGVSVVMQNVQRQEAGPFKTALDNMRKGTVSKEDIDLLLTRHWHRLDSAERELFELQALFLFPTWKRTKKITIEYLRQLAKPIAKLRAKYNFSGKTNHAKKDINLPDFSALCINAVVMLLINFIVELGLKNGSIGVCKDIIYAEACGPYGEDQPLYAVVDFPEYKGEPWDNANPTYVPVPLVTLRCEKKCCSQTTLPLRVCKAITIYKSQGITVGEGPDCFWKFVVVGMDEANARNRAPGQELVAFSRAQNLRYVAIYDDVEVTRDAFTKIGTGKGCDRKREWEQFLLDNQEDSQQWIREQITSLDPQENKTFEGGYNFLCQWYHPFQNRYAQSNSTESPANQSSGNLHPEQNSDIMSAGQPPPPNGPSNVATASRPTLQRTSEFLTSQNDMDSRVINPVDGAEGQLTQPQSSHVVEIQSSQPQLLAVPRQPSVVVINDNEEDPTPIQLPPRRPQLTASQQAVAVETALSQVNVIGLPSRFHMDPSQMRTVLEHIYDETGDEEEVLCGGVGGVTESIRRKKFQSLKNGKYLCDDVVNAYLLLCIKRHDRRRQLMDPPPPSCARMRSHFYETLTNDGGTGTYQYTERIQRLAKNTQLIPGGNIFELDKLIVPINIALHWYVVIVFMQERRIAVYDSLPVDGDEAHERYFGERGVTTMVLKFLDDHHRHFYGGAPLPHYQQWKENVTGIHPNQPLQGNFVDCGVPLQLFGTRFGRGRITDEPEKHDLLPAVDRSLPPSTGDS